MPTNEWRYTSSPQYMQTDQINAQPLKHARHMCIYIFSSQNVWQHMKISTWHLIHADVQTYASSEYMQTHTGPRNKQTHVNQPSALDTGKCMQKHAKLTLRAHTCTYTLTSSMFACTCRYMVSPQYLHAHADTHSALDARKDIPTHA